MCIYLGMPLGNKHNDIGNVGWYCGEDRKEISKMEGSVFVLGRKTLSSTQS